jgi:predicted glycosyltransferase
MTSPSISKSRRILYYAINGLGIGHAKRLVALARPLRRLARERGVSVEQMFITSCEAGQVLYMERFAYFKLPSLSAAEESGVDKTAYLGFAKEWVRQTLALLAPDAFVVDTFPNGAFNELSGTGSITRNRHLVYRPSRPERAREARFQAALSEYDRLLVPERKENSNTIVPRGLEERTTYYGPVLARDREDLLARDAARSRLGLSGEAFVIYLSFGGGGDPEAEKMLHWVLSGLQDMSNVWVVIGAGPLYRGLPYYRANCIWLTDVSVCELMNAFDIAISAAGYNSFCELMHFGVPTVFVPLSRVMDDQEARAGRAVAAGAGQILLPYAGAQELREAVNRWLSRGVRAEAAERARSLVPRNYAKDMAADILSAACA